MFHLQWVFLESLHYYTSHAGQHGSDPYTVGPSKLGFSSSSTRAALHTQASWGHSTYPGAYISESAVALSM